MSDAAVYLGIDMGTSGARVIGITGDGSIVAEGRSALSEHGRDHRDPAAWWSAVCAAIEQALPALAGHDVRGLCVDGTSGTLVALAADDTVLAPGSMYNDTCNDADILNGIQRHAPAHSAVHGPSSALARSLMLQRRFNPHRLVHQADWIAGKLCGVYASDDNNALKTGYDSVSSQWPTWLAHTGLDTDLLPPVNEPGTPFAQLSSALAARWSLPEELRMIAGTTDGCASFLATGAAQAGDGVTALGSTLTIKLLSDEPIFDASSGIYSHRVMGLWLAGGASNSGGNVLLAYFDEPEIQRLSAHIDAESDTGLDFYPLASPGERFPIADPALPPRLTPEPADRTRFLQGMFEGIADIETLAYQRLAEYGAPTLRSVRTVGGGAANPVWTRLRERRLGVSMLAPTSTEAAYGTALLARFGCVG